MTAATEGRTSTVGGKQNGRYRKSVQYTTGRVQYITGRVQYTTGRVQYTTGRVQYTTQESCNEIHEVVIP